MQAALVKITCTITLDQSKLLQKIQQKRHSEEEKKKDLIGIHDNM